MDNATLYGSPTFDGILTRGAVIENVEAWYTSIPFVDWQPEFVTKAGSTIRRGIYLDCLEIKLVWIDTNKAYFNSRGSFWKVHNHQVHGLEDDNSTPYTILDFCATLERFARDFHLDLEDWKFGKPELNIQLRTTRPAEDYIDKVVSVKQTKLNPWPCQADKPGKSTFFDEYGKRVDKDYGFKTYGGGDILRVEASGELNKLAREYGVHWPTYAHPDTTQRKDGTDLPRWPETVAELIYMCRNHTAAVEAEILRVNTAQINQLSFRGPEAAQLKADLTGALPAWTKPPRKPRSRNKGGEIARNAVAPNTGGGITPPMADKGISSFDSIINEENNSIVNSSPPPPKKFLSDEELKIRKFYNSLSHEGRKLLVSLAK